jgi:hypothetical protein
MLPSLPGLMLLTWLWAKQQLDLLWSPMMGAAWIGFCFAHLVHIVADWL